MEQKGNSIKDYQLVIFKIGKEEFGVEIGEVKEIVRMLPVTYVPRAPSFVEGVINLRGQILVLIDLAKRLNLKSIGRSEKTRIIVVDVEGSSIGMVVDEVTEVLRLSKDNIEEPPQIIATDIHQRYIKGVGKWGERLFIIIDLAKILSFEEVEEIKRTEFKEKV
ncbi:MAG: chemotaxis protein CheW [Candidatus Omnitrophica bacterium]|nr:chemotaxis protein CheW [Candidatus Omnitrophota bacterium]